MRARTVYTLVGGVRACLASGGAGGTCVGRGMVVSRTQRADSRALAEFLLMSITIAVVALIGWGGGQIFGSVEHTPLGCAW